MNSLLKYFKLLLYMGILTFLVSGCAKNLNLTEDIHCYKAYTSLGETTKACVKYTNSDYTKKLNFSENLKYKEVVIEKLTFARDYIQFDNNLVVPELEIYIHAIGKSVSITPVFVDKSWIDKGLGIGSILRHDTSDDRLSEDIRYFIIGYLENTDKEGLYSFIDTDINDYSCIYGSCGRKCHYFPLEVIEYKPNVEKESTINEAYKKENISMCMTFEEAEKDPEKAKNASCIADCRANFSEESCAAGVDFAKKIKYAFRHKDFETFANIIPYPITISEIETSSGKVKSSITISSKRELLNLDKGKIMNDKIFKAIDENDIFVNWKGFMLGNGTIWWFQSGSKISDLRINISD